MNKIVKNFAGNYLKLSILSILCRHLILRVAILISVMPLSQLKILNILNYDKQESKNTDFKVWKIRNTCHKDIQNKVVRRLGLIFIL